LVSRAGDEGQHHYDSWTAAAARTALHSHVRLQEGRGDACAGSENRLGDPDLTDGEVCDPEKVSAGDAVSTLCDGPIVWPCHALPQVGTPIGTMIHNSELAPNRGGQMARAAGTAAQVMAKEGEYAHVRLPSGEVRLVRVDCKATIGQVSNLEHDSVTLGKAGRKRWLGVRPGVRGVAMDPASHPHGGGEGRSPIGMPGPVSPWGKPTLG